MHGCNGHEAGGIGQGRLRSASWRMLPPGTRTPGKTRRARSFAALRMTALSCHA